MSDGTKSGYTKTGKKVMCINSNRIDLTYKKVYDVFTNQDSVDFIIDDVGDKRYESLELPYWCEKSDGMVDKANETKPKFKVGDKVKVVDDDYISIYTHEVELGDVGVIINIDDNGADSYQVNFNETDDKNYWWFTDKCIELVDDTVDTDNTIGETNNKFKEGDKVMLVNTDYISTYTDSVTVGDIGTVISVFESGVDKYYVDFGDTDYECRWFFTDNCIELVFDSSSTNQYNPLAVQQSGNHYKNGEIQPIEYSERNNLSMCQGNIVKYISRHKEKNGVDDLAKVVHYALLEALFVYGEDGATELRDKIDSLINIKNGF